VLQDRRDRNGGTEHVAQGTALSEGQDLCDRTGRQDKWSLSETGQAGGKGKV
jgi:hypothetical protein